MEKHYPEILRRYLGQERDDRVGNYDITTKTVADICGSSQSTSEAAKRPEPIGREERSAFGEQIKPIEEAALREFSFHQQLWISESDFSVKYGARLIGAGAEQKVYLSDDGRNVLKVNCGRFHTNWLEYFNRLLFHGYVFPSTAYKTVGFTEDEGKFGVITQQQFAILDQGAPRSVVESYLKSHGFERFKNDDYYNKNTGVKLEDLHDENVFLGESGNILFIDPVIYFETLDMKLGGQCIFHFPFNG